MPRLELLGALLCARLTSFVREVLRLHSDTVYNCWTDSFISFLSYFNSPIGESGVSLLLHVHIIIRNVSS
jgi:hypothetical protein